MLLTGIRTFVTFVLVGITLQIQLSGQVQTFTRQDSLRGSITQERIWWDLVFYHLEVQVNPEDSTIQGSNSVYYQVLKPYQVMQIDLQPPLRLTAALQDGKSLKIRHEGNAHFIRLQEEQVPGTLKKVVLNYQGKPRVAKRPPWDGGFTWSRDEQGYPFIATSCQGIGASIWWPCKDHMYDEPDSMLISVCAPAGLMDVSNGRLRNTTVHSDGSKTWHWFVANPINNYGVNINIGRYAHLAEVFKGLRGDLTCDYYVLPEDLVKARKQFRQVPKMLKAFEYWFGPYPFYEDGYKLVQVPYLGMEHQSSVTYGNGFENGYLGRDLSGTGWGNTFDFIIIHESAHEWFANNITYRDIADMWIHESFANYAESLYVEYYHGKKAGAEYLRGTRSGIRNDRPIIGTYGVNSTGSGDMYPKGGNMLNTLRRIAANDSLWRETLRGLNETFYHQTVTTDQVENYIARKLDRDLQGFFDQYLRDRRVPVLEYYFRGDTLHYRWSGCVRNFNMPVDVTIDGNPMRLKPLTLWQEIQVSQEEHHLLIDPDYYVAGFNLMGIDQHTNKNLTSK